MSTRSTGSDEGQAAQGLHFEYPQLHLRHVPILFGNAEPGLR